MSGCLVTLQRSSLCGFILKSESCSYHVALASLELAVLSYRGLLASTILPEFYFLNVS